jgi:hypothetical protein
MHDDGVLRDHDFHPDESSVRIFCTPDRGILRLDNQIVITEARHDGVVLRHYALADRWFKVNVTTDLAGNVVDTGDPGQRFAYNCDIATPMERDAGRTFGVDLFIDVLVRDNATSYIVGDQDEFQQAIEHGLISRAEHRAHDMVCKTSSNSLSAADSLSGCTNSPRSLPAGLRPRRRWNAARFPVVCSRDCAEPGTTLLPRSWPLRRSTQTRRPVPRQQPAGHPPRHKWSNAAQPMVTAPEWTT